VSASLQDNQLSGGKKFPELSALTRRDHPIGPGSDDQSRPTDRANSMTQVCRIGSPHVDGLWSEARTAEVVNDPPERSGRHRLCASAGEKVISDLSSKQLLAQFWMDPDMDCSRKKAKPRYPLRTDDRKLKDDKAGKRVAYQSYRRCCYGLDEFSEPADRHLERAPGRKRIVAMTREINRHPALVGRSMAHHILPLPHASPESV